MLSVKNKTNIQKDSVTQTADSVEGIVNHIHYLEGAVDIQAETIAQSSGLIEQMVGGINEVRAVVRRADETTENLSKSSDASHKMLIGGNKKHEKRHQNHGQHVCRSN